MSARLVAALALLIGTPAWTLHACAADPLCTTAREADPADECFIPRTCRECSTDAECEALCPESLDQQEEDCTDEGNRWVNGKCEVTP